MNIIDDYHDQLVKPVVISVLEPVVNDDELSVVVI